MCDDCWAELAGGGFGASVAVDSFAPPSVLAQLALSGSPAELGALASRGATNLPGAVVEVLAAAGVAVAVEGSLTDLIEARAFAAGSAAAANARRASKLMLAGVGVVVVAAAVATFAASRVLHGADTTNASVASTVTAAPPSTVPAAATSTSSTSSTSTSSTSSTSTSSTSTSSAMPVPAASTVPATPAGTSAPVVTSRPAPVTTVATTSPPATSPPVTSPPATSPPAASWVPVSVSSCSSSPGVEVSIEWVIVQGAASAFRLLHDGTQVAGLRWVGDGAVAGGEWSVQADVAASPGGSGRLVLVGCA